MPNYGYRCSGCDSEFDRRLPLDRFDEPQICECGVTASRQFSVPSFILKGDGWVGKNLRIAGQMASKNRRLDKKQDERKRDSPGLTLAPNVDGERVDSWSDAQKLAASKGKNVNSYAPKVREEQKKG